MTTVEWLKSNLETFGDPKVCTISWEDLDSLMLQAEQMEKKKEYQTQAFWYGRGIAAAKEDKIKEYAPVKPE